MEIKLWGPALSWAGAGGGVWPPCRRIPGVGAALTGPAYNEKLLIYHSDKTSRPLVCYHHLSPARTRDEMRIDLQSCFTKMTACFPKFRFPPMGWIGTLDTDTDRTIAQIFYNRRSRVDHRSRKLATTCFYHQTLINTFTMVLCHCTDCELCQWTSGRGFECFWE